MIVICSHLNLRQHVFDNLKSIHLLEPFILFFTDGGIGVNTFFIISGFLITTLLIIEEKQNDKISLKNFFLRRSLRIFPAYYVLLLVYFLFQFTGLLSFSNSSWLTSLTYTKYFNWSSDWETAHAWSLSVEEQFYLIWPFMFIAGKKIRKWFAFCIVCLVPVLKIYTHFYPVSWINDLTIFTRIDAIETGCLLAIYKDTILKKLQWRPNLIFYLAIIFLFILPYLPGFEINYHLHFGFILIPFGTTYGTISNVCLSIIIMYLVFGPNNYWKKFMNTRILKYIGTISYSIYLWQQIFFNDKFWISQFPQNIPCIFITATISYYIIEKPFLNLKTKFQRVSHGA